MAKRKPHRRKKALPPLKNRGMTIKSRYWRRARRGWDLYVEDWMSDWFRGGYMRLTMRVGSRTLRRTLSRDDVDGLIWMLAVRMSDVDLRPHAALLAALERCAPGYMEGEISA